MSEEDKPKRGMFSRLFGRGKPDEVTTSEESIVAEQEAALSEPAVTTDAPEPITPDIPEVVEAEAVEPALSEPDAPFSEPERSEEVVADLSPAPVVDEPALDAPKPDVPEIDPQSTDEAAAEDKPRQGWFSRLKSGLAKSSSKLTTGIAEVFTKRKLDGAMLDDLEDLLIQSDLGVEPAMEITEALRASRYDKDISPQEVKEFLAGEIERRLTPVALPLVIPDTPRPYVILVVGVNGSGKTTTIGKLAAKFGSEGKKIVLAAGDTFRAAAIDQLKIWGSRVSATVVARDVGSDAAGLVFDAHEAAIKEGADVLMIDTAGRLQNKSDLMAELEKVVRVLAKKEAGAPHAVLLVLDATVGQNAISQATVFGEIAGVTGLVMTKLDGTARGGILVALAAKFGLPVHAIGVGEGVNDLQAFSAAEFARAIAGTEAMSEGNTK